jgi:hypothetical protein
MEIKLSRIDKALYMIDRKGFGLEIGPSLNPILPKKAGFDVETLDHATAEELRTKYQYDPARIDNIEAVDYVWHGEPLDELIGAESKYDFIIASHVIEHVPDLVSFLSQCAVLLKPDGVLSLIIPDKRYCFDYLRWPSSTGDVLQAFTEKRTRHKPGTVFDHFANAVTMSSCPTWGPGKAVEELNYVRGLEQAKQLWQQALTTDDYVDMHGWRFTPSSFKLILDDLYALGLTDMVETCFFETTGCEFYVSLRKSKVPMERKISRLQLAKDAMVEQLNGFIPIELRGTEKPLKLKDGVLFIHIAKAAGSSINRFFINNYTSSKCLVHIESQKDVLTNPISLEDKLFVSGHITYREFKARLVMQNYFVVTCLREPVAHIISHLAWVRKLAEPSERNRFEAHPPFIQKLAIKLMAVDLGSPVAIKALIEALEPRERELLDNVQVNYLHECSFLGPIGDKELASALEVIDKLDLIGVVEHLDAFFSSLSSYLGVKSTHDTWHENIQSNKYGMDANDLEFRAAIEPLIRYDQILYKKVKEKSFANKLVVDVKNRKPGATSQASNVFNGSLDKASLKLIHGWCASSGTTSPIQVVLYVNDEEVATTEAVLPRPDVCQRGFHRTGLCGFRFNPQGQPILRVGDVVSVKAINDGALVELRNSPRAIELL